MDGRLDKTATYTAQTHPWHGGSVVLDRLTFCRPGPTAFALQGHVK
jgi:hypothetical protein